MKLLQFKTTLALLVFGAGCTALLAPACHASVNTECNNTCAQLNKCTGAAQTNCSVSCNNLDTVVAASGCGASYDDAANCYGGVTDVCTDHSCDAKRNSAIACICTYCLTHSGDTACAGQPCMLGG